MTDLPVTDLPVTDLPVTDLPVTDLPVTDLSVTGLLVPATWPALPGLIRPGAQLASALAWLGWLGGDSDPDPGDFPIHS